MEEAQRLCDRVAVIDGGRILAIDAIPRLLEQHGGESVVLGKLASPTNGNVSIPGTIDGLNLRFESSNPFQEISRLHSAGIEFSNLEIKQPDLETVFLKLTGKSLRD